MIPIEGWALVYNFGSFLASASIAFSAISSLYDRINLRKYEIRLDYLRRLNNMMQPSAMSSENGKKYFIEIDPLTYFDNTFISILWDNIFPNDRAILSAGTVWVAKPPNFEMERQKRLLYQNKGSVPGLIATAEADMGKLNCVYKIILLLFIIGLIIQLGSLFVSWIDP